MKIATILDHVDSGDIALPQFQRGYVWNRDQVRGLFMSLYNRYPVGGLLVWNTEAETADRREGSPPVAGMVNLLLDGQQRVTSIYGVVRGKPPAFFEGNQRAFAGLQFHLKSETFEFYQPTRMSTDPKWIDVSTLMQEGIAPFIDDLKSDSEFSTHVEKLAQLESINQTEFPIEAITGRDKTLDVVVEIFNRVNSGGTKLSKGDLTLARISAAWPAARDAMNAKLAEWETHGFDFDLDWLLRCITTILTGRAQFDGLHDTGAAEFQDGFKRAVKQIENCLNLIADRLGLDHNRVLFGQHAVPVMVYYMDQLGRSLDPAEKNKILYWYIQAGMWGRFSGSTDTTISQDLATLKTGGLDSLLEQMHLWRRGFRLQSNHFSGWSMGTRFYPVLYMLTRTGESRDLGSGLPLSSSLLGKMSQLEMHHIFPKSLLYKHKYTKSEVNALANFCFLTKDTNLKISNQCPETYLAEVERTNPGTLASQWIPQDPTLWRLDRYPDFLEARRKLLAKAANDLLDNLLPQRAQRSQDWANTYDVTIPEPVGGISSEKEANLLETLSVWVSEQGMPKGTVGYDYMDEETGERLAIFDLAWPVGLQAGLSDPVAVLLNEPAEVLKIASAAGFRCFTTAESFKKYLLTEVGGEDEELSEVLKLSGAPA